MAQDGRSWLQEPAEATQANPAPTGRSWLQGAPAASQAVLEAPALTADSPRMDGIPPISLDGALNDFRVAPEPGMGLAYPPGPPPGEMPDIAQELEAAGRTVGRVGVEQAASLPQNASILLGTLGLIQEKTGIPIWPASNIQDNVKHLDAAAQAILKKRPEYGKTDFPFMTQGVVSGFAQMGAFVAGGAATKSFGAAARMATIATQGAMLEMSTGYWEALAKDPNDTRTALKVALAKAPGGASEAFLDVLFRTDKLSGGLMSKALKNALLGVVTEVPQEMGQTVWGNAVTRYFLDPAHGYFEGVGEAAGVAAIVGGGTGGVLGAIDGMGAVEPTPDNVAAAMEALKRTDPDSPSFAKDFMSEMRALGVDVAIPGEDLRVNFGPGQTEQTQGTADPAVRENPEKVGTEPPPDSRESLAPEGAVAPMESFAPEGVYPAADAVAPEAVVDAAPQDPGVQADDLTSPKYSGRKGWASLRQLANDEGLANPGKLTRDEIVAGLREKRAQAAPEAAVTPPASAAPIITVFHGGARFDQPDLSKLGSGEGRQAQGWGMYASDLSGVGSHYRRQYQEMHGKGEGKPVSDADFRERAERRQNEEVARKGLRLTHGYLFDPTGRRLTLLREKMSEEDFSRLMREAPTLDAFTQNPGASTVRFMSTLRILARGEAEIVATHFAGDYSSEINLVRDYSLDIPNVEDVSELHQWAVKADPNMLMHWEQPLSQQDERIITAVSGALGHAGVLGALRRRGLRKLTGRAAYIKLVETLGSERAASLALAAQGLPGHKYVAAPARGGAGDKFNYVFYDTSIIEKVGPAASQEPAPAAPAPEQPSQPVEPPDAVQPPTEPPGGVPEEGADDGIVSVKNRVIDAERARMNLPPATHGEKRRWETLNEEAAAKEGADPFAGQKLLQDISGREGDRPLRDDEVILATRELRRLKNERNAVARDVIAAQEAGDTATVESLNERAMALQNEVFEAGEILTRAGTVSGQALAARRAEMREDYSLATLEQQMRVAQKGRPLSDDQRAEVAALSAELEKAQAEFDAYVSKSEDEKATLEAENALLRIKKTVGRAKPASKAKTDPGKVLEFISARAAEARERIRKRGHTAFAGIDPVAFADVIIIGAEYVAKGTSEFVAWSKAMVAEFGAKITPHLQAIHDKSVETAESYSKQVDLGGVKEKMAARSKEGDDLTSMRAQVRQLSEFFVSQGADSVSALTDEVHDFLRDIMPDVTRRQVMDAISGYGDFTPLSKAEIKVKLRDLRGQMQQLAKLADMIGERKAPSKTGQEQRTPTARERELTKQVNEVKKRLNIQTVDPEHQLQSALDGIKTRLRNQIEDLQRQIDTRAMTVKRPGRPQKDAEILALEAERDKLREQYDDIFSDAREDQRTDRAVAAITKSIAEYERRISEKDLSPRAAANPVRANAELEAARNWREVLREELALMRQAQNPKKTPEEIALQTAKTRMANEIARLQERNAAGDFTKKPRKETVLDDAGATLKAKLEMLRKEHRRGVIRLEIENRTTAQKIGHALLEPSALVRAIKSAYDASAPFRQAGMIFVGDLVFRPARAIKRMGKMFKAGMSDLEFEKLDAKLRARPMAEFGDKAKLELTSLDDDLRPHEEAIHSRLSDKIPGIRLSNRMFVTFLNQTRADAFDRIAASLPDPTIEELKHIAYLVNIFTGRGQLHGKFAGTLEGLAVPLWAPRLMLSRVQVLVGAPLYSFEKGPGLRGTRRTRRLVAREYGRYLAGMAALYGLFALAGGELEWDPRSTDFGKVKFGGKTRIDPMAGLSQVAVLVSRLVTSQTKTGSGDVVSISGPDRPYGQPNATTLVGRFARSKLAPGFAVPWNIVSREDFLGRPLTPLDIAEDALMPLSIGDTYEAIKEHGVSGGAALGVLSLLGMGVQVYETGGNSSTRPTRSSRSKRPSR